MTKKYRLFFAIGMFFALFPIYLQWPNILLNIDFLYPIKITLLTWAFIFFCYNSKLKNHKIYIHFAILICPAFIISLINDKIIFGYFAAALVYLILFGFFLKHPDAGTFYMKMGIWISVAFSIHIIFIHFLTVEGVDFSYDYISVVGIENPIKFNLLTGGYFDVGEPRIPGYFSEANKMAYFLIPSFFFCLYFSSRSVIYTTILFFLSVGIFLTFSIAAMSAIILTLAVFLFIKIRSWILRFLILSVSCVLLSLLVVEFDILIEHINRAGSYSIRVEGIKTEVELFSRNLFGLELELVNQILSSNPRANSTLTLLRWMLFGGLFSGLLLLLMNLLWLFSCIVLMRVKHFFFPYAGLAGFSSLLVQNFYGSYYEYYFLSIMAFVAVSVFLLKNDIFLKSDVSP